MNLLIVFLLTLTIISKSESVLRSARVGESGSSNDLFALRGDRVILTYAYRGVAQSVTFGWFISVGGVSTPALLSAVSNPARFTTSFTGSNATVEFDFDTSITDGTSFRPLVTVTTVINGSTPSSSSSFAGSVAVKLGVIPKLRLDSISDDVAIAERDPITISVNVIEGRPNPIVNFSNTTRDQSPIFVAVNSTHYQIRKMSASISDGGVYKVVATNVVGRVAINFTVTVHFLRLLDCDLCNAKNGSIANCTFSSSPKPSEVESDSQIVPMKEVVEFDTDNYVVSVAIPGQPRQYTFMITNGYSSPILIDCTPPSTGGPTSTSTSSEPGSSTAPPATPPATPPPGAPSDDASDQVGLIAGCAAAGGVALIALLLLLLCPIKLSCRRCLQRRCCSCCFKCYDDCCGTQGDCEEPNKSKATCCTDSYKCSLCCFNCCNDSSGSDEADGHKKDSVPLGKIEETVPVSAAAASSKKQEDEIEPYVVSGGAVSATKEEKSKAAPKSASKDEYAQPDMSKKTKKKAAQQAPTGGDVYAQVDKKKKAEKSDLTYADLDHSGSKSGTLQSASNEGGVVYSKMQKK